MAKGHIYRTIAVSGITLCSPLSIDGAIYNQYREEAGEIFHRL